MVLLNTGREMFAFSLFGLTYFVSITEGQQYNLTGSSEFAMLGEAFTWTCYIELPPGDTVSFVKFYRNNVLCVLIGSTSSGCATQSALPRYSYYCVSDIAYSLTIPAESMTEFEQGSIWRCEYHNKPLFKSPDITLRIAVDVYNVSMLSSDNPLTLREGNRREVRCVVNSNAVPAPTISWHLGSINITSRAGTDTTLIMITGNRTDNGKALECRASNNNKQPKTASTVLNVEYPPTTNTLFQQNIAEGRDLSVTCRANSGNPSSTSFIWTKVDNPGFTQNGSTLHIPNIQRTSSGTYRCTTENNYSNGERGTDSQAMVVNVQYPPSVNTLSQQEITEGRDLSVTCQVTPGNPRSTTVYWTKVENSGFRQNGHTLHVPNIQRTSSGTYRCTAENNYSNGEKGTHNQSMVVNVFYPPVVNTLFQQDIIEGRDLSVTCQAITGNPTSTTFYWTKVDNQGFTQNGATLQLPNIQRTSSGTYICTAENIYSNGEKGTDSQSMVINVLYPPVVNALSNQNTIEGGGLTVNCTATPGNPSATTFYWTKVDNQGFRQNGAILQLYNTQRTSSGTYKCTAENNYSNGKKGTHSLLMVIDVLYPPVVNALSNQNIIEGGDLTVNCTATPGNPSATTFYWTKENNPGFRQNGPTLRLLNIQRNSSGTYICTAENMYSNGNKGTDSQSMVVNVIYQPAIENRPLQIVNESETVILTRNISGNPLSNVSWFNKTELLKTQTSVTTTSLFIERATCSDTQNFTLVASNGVGSNATAVVELIVNCKPIPYKTNITLGVTFTTGIEFSIKIIAYPVPQYELVYENGTRNNQMLNYITRNAVNNFTVYYRQVVVDQSSFGLYYLTMRNLFGESTVTVNVIEQRTGRPETPRSIAVVCEITQARIQWISPFNGGDQQYFTVVLLNCRDGTNISYRFHDKGENELHAAHISNLQPLVTYWFVVSAKNSYGSSPSEITRCKTGKEKASSKTGMVVGSVGGALVLITIVLILGIAHRRYTCICKIALEKKDRNTTVDANKDKSNYSTIQEQQEHSERNMYDALTSTENANQYEDILKKDNNGYDEKLYEKLQSSTDKDNEASSSKRRIPLKIKDLKDDKFVTQNTEEYANTAFME